MPARKRKPAAPGQLSPTADSDLSRFLKRDQQFADKRATEAAAAAAERDRLARLDDLRAAKDAAARDLRTVRSKDRRSPDEVEAVEQAYRLAVTRVTRFEAGEAIDDVPDTSTVETDTAAEDADADD